MSNPTRPSYMQTRAVFRLLNEVSELSRRPGNAGWREHMVDGLCRMLDARQGTSVVMDGWSPDGELRMRSIARAGEANDQLIKAWFAGLLPADPRKDTLIDLSTRLPGALRTRTRQQLITEPSWEQTWEYLAMKDLDVGQQLCCWFKTDARTQSVDAMVFHRPFGGRMFSARERNLLHLFNVEYYRMVGEGRIVLSPHEPADAGLTPRQREVLRRLLAGDSEKQAASTMGITHHTVNDHVKAIHRHFGVSSRGELLAKCFRPR